MSQARKLIVELAITLDAAPSKMAERDIQEAVKDLGDSLAYLGKITRCELITLAAPVAEQDATP